MALTLLTAIRSTSERFSTFCLTANSRCTRTARKRTLQYSYLFLSIQIVLPKFFRKELLREAEHYKMPALIDYLTGRLVIEFDALRKGPNVYVKGSSATNVTKLWQAARWLDDQRRSFVHLQLARRASYHGWRYR